jgi:glycosyltransferase involved in cell wall biosynthesis
MRVLQVIPTLAARTGGPPVAVIESSRALKQCGVETTVFATDMAESASAAHHTRVAASDLPDGAAELDVRLFPARWPQRLAFSPAMYSSLGQAAQDYDVVHIHSLFLFPQFAAFHQASARHTPYVVSPRGSLDPHLRKRSRAIKAITDVLWQRRCLEGAAALHLTSADERDLISDIAPLVPRRVIPNGIRWSDYQDLPSGDTFRARWLASSDAPVVMYLGRLSHKKGLDVLIRAFAIIAREIPAARLAIVGPDDEGLTPALRVLAEREHVADRVVFAGMLQGEEKLSALAAADVWALPSMTENFGNAIVEAMAAGVPVVISPEVNIATDVARECAGVIAERTPEVFATEILTLLRNEARRHEIAERGRAFTRRYDWSVVGPRLAAMYEDVARRN